MYSLKEFKAVFDPVLDDYLTQRINSFLEKTSDPFIKDFVLYSKQLTMAGGKRIRPYIAFVMYTALGGKQTDAALKLFVALEIFHTFALMHDDIMDKADTRHGVKTLHAYVNEKLKSNNRIGDIENVAKAQGILVGDLYFSWALEIFLGENGFVQENIKSSQNYFYKMMDEVVLGQIIDIDITTREKADCILINEKTNLKTSRYTFVRPMQIGASLANVNHGMDDFCENLGTKLGMAFQIQDDLLDIIGDPKILEKNILRDITDHQHTFFTDYVFSNGTTLQKHKLNEYFGKEPNEKESREIIKIFEDSGAVAAGKTTVTASLKEAEKILQTSNLGHEFKEVCFDLIKLMQERQK